MNKTVLVIISLGLIVALGIIFSGNKNGEQTLKNNVEIKDGIQYITVLASGGYFPQTTIAKSDIPTKLIMKTGGTFDCSASLAIREIKFQKILPPNKETEIDIGVHKVGEEMDGVCGMGMYNFTIKFEA